MVYPRFVSAGIEQALADTPCVLLTGPRQSGKTTLIEKWGTPSMSVSFDDWSVLHQARNDPEGFVTQLAARNPGQLVVMDEIQYVPELFLPIKRMIDQQRRAGMFLITGSANLLSWSKTPDSLAGRIEYLNLYPLSLLEIRGKNISWIDRFFDGNEIDFQMDVESFKCSQEEIEVFTVKGGFPDAFKRDDFHRRSKWFDAYLKSLLEKDIHDLSGIEQPLLLHNLLKHMAYRCGSTVNMTDLATKLQSTVITIKKYLALLQMMFLICPLPSWHRNLGKRLVKSSKIYLIDPGLLSHILGLDPSDPSIRGMLLEQLVFNELQKQLSWNEKGLKLYYWRTTDGKEVDFVVENRKGQIIGIEVKAKTTLTPSDWSSLKILESQVGNDFMKGIVIYNGKNSISLSRKIMAVPLSRLY
jgi:predicted AAA+ superfamily ATPase